MHDSTVSSFDAGRENQYLREKIVGCRVTKAWAQPEGYVFEFDHKHRLQLDSSGADWLELKLELPLNTLAPLS